MTHYLYLSDYGNKFVSALMFSEQKRKTAMQVYEADNDFVFIEHRFFMQLHTICTNRIYS